MLIRTPARALRAGWINSQGEAIKAARVALWAHTISGSASPWPYEVVWSRILAVLFDGSIYGFVLMLATVLFGIAAGGALGGLLVRWQPRAQVAGLAFGWLELGIGLAAVLALVAFGGAYDALLAIRTDGPGLLLRFVSTDLRLADHAVRRDRAAGGVAHGGDLPGGRSLVGASADTIGRRLGDVYAGNVAGAIVGALASGFLLVPLLGAHASLLLLASANVLLGAAILSAAGHLRRALASGVLALGVVAWGATRPALLPKVVFHEHFHTINGSWPTGRPQLYCQRRTRPRRRADPVCTNSRDQTNDAPDLVRATPVMGHLAALLAPVASTRAPSVVRLRSGARHWARWPSTSGPGRHRRAFGEASSPPRPAFSPLPTRTSCSDLTCTWPSMMARNLLFAAATASGTT